MNSRRYKVQLQTEMGWSDLKGWDGRGWTARVVECDGMGEAYAIRDQVCADMDCRGRVVDSRVEEDVDIYWHWCERKEAK